MKFVLGGLTLNCVTTESGDIVVKSAAAEGNLEKLLCALLGISTIDSDLKEAPPVELASVSDMSLLSGPPKGGPNLGAVDHLGNQASASLNKPVVNSGGPVAVSGTVITHSSGEQQYSLPLDDSGVTDTPANPVAYEGAVQVSPAMLAAFAPPKVLPPDQSTATVSQTSQQVDSSTKIVTQEVAKQATNLTSLNPAQQQVASQFSVPTNMDTGTRLSTDKLSAAGVAYVTRVFSQVQTSTLERLREISVTKLMLDPTVVASLDRPSLENTFWNTLVKQAASK